MGRRFRQKLQPGYLPALLQKFQLDSFPAFPPTLQVPHLPPPQLAKSPRPRKRRRQKNLKKMKNKKSKKKSKAKKASQVKNKSRRPRKEEKNECLSPNVRRPRRLINSLASLRYHL